jgi:predicted nucleic acid-binding protein
LVNYREIYTSLRSVATALHGFYVALAESESAVLVTDDDKLIRLAKQARLGKWMKALATFGSGSK